MDDSLLKILDELAEQVGQTIAAGETLAHYNELSETLAAVSQEFPGDQREMGPRPPVDVRVRGCVHRRPPNGTAPRTQHAGDLVNDLLVLSHQPDDGSIGLCIYLADDEMAGYMGNPANGLHRLYDLKRGEEHLLQATFFDDRPPSFTQRLKVPVGPVRLVSLLHRDYPGGHGLRVWQVMSSSALDIAERMAPIAEDPLPESAADVDRQTLESMVSLDMPDDWHELVTAALHVALEVERDEYGAVSRFQPQAEYENTERLPLNRYGSGSFCRFRVPGDIHRAGVYLIVASGQLAYVAECEDFSRRFNTGYGQISPRDCYKGGEETDCRINQMVLTYAEGGSGIEVYFIETAGRFALEEACIDAYQPPWNQQ